MSSLKSAMLGQLHQAVFGLESSSSWFTKSSAKDASIRSRNTKRTMLQATFRSVGLGCLPALGTDTTFGGVLPESQPYLVKALDRLLGNTVMPEMLLNGTGYLLGNKSLPSTPSSILPCLLSLAEQANGVPNLETINGAGLREQVQKYADRQAVNAAQALTDSIRKMLDDVSTRNRIMGEVRSPAMLTRLVDLVGAMIQDESMKAMSIKGNVRTSLGAAMVPEQVRRLCDSAKQHIKSKLDTAHRDIVRQAGQRLMQSLGQSMDDADEVVMELYAVQRLTETIESASGNNTSMEMMTPDGATTRSMVLRDLEAAINGGSTAASDARAAFREHLESEWAGEVLQRMGNARRAEERGGAEEGAANAAALIAQMVGVGQTSSSSGRAKATTSLGGAATPELRAARHIGSPSARGGLSQGYVYAEPPVSDAAILGTASVGTGTSVD